MHLRTLILALAAVVPFGCATSGGGSAAAAPAAEFKSTGEVRYAAGGQSYSASFSEDRVVSPIMDVSRTGDGSWRGRIAGSVVDVSVYPDRVAGSGLTMSLEEQEGGAVEISAQQEGRILRFEFDAEKLVIRTPSFSTTLANNGDGTFGTGGTVKLMGDAVKEKRPWPQFALALVGTFLSPGGVGSTNY